MKIVAMIPQAEAAHGEPISQKACDALREKSPVSPPIGTLLADHCSVVPPEGGG